MKELEKLQTVEAGRSAECFTSHQQETAAARAELHSKPLHNLTVVSNLGITRSMNTPQ